MLNAFVGKTDKIFNDIEQPLFCKNAFKKRIKLCILRIFITAVFGFPFHEAVFPGRNGSCFGHRKIADDTDTIINKHGRDFMHVIANLLIRF